MLDAYKYLASLISGAELLIDTEVFTLQGWSPGLSVALATMSL